MNEIFGPFGAILIFALLVLFVLSLIASYWQTAAALFVVIALVFARYPVFE